MKQNKMKIHIYEKFNYRQYPQNNMSISNTALYYTVISRLLLLMVVYTKYTGIAPLDGRECFIFYNNTLILVDFII